MSGSAVHQRQNPALPFRGALGRWNEERFPREIWGKVSERLASTVLEVQ